MKSRNELAEAILLQLLTLAPSCDGPEIVVAEAFAFADAFLAAAGEQQRQEREPDAVWTLTRMASSCSFLRDTTDPKLPVDIKSFVGPHDGFSLIANRLLAGRERVRLRVYVEEVES